MQRFLRQTRKNPAIVSTLTRPRWNCQRWFVVFLIRERHGGRLLKFQCQPLAQMRTSIRLAGSVDFHPVAPASLGAIEGGISPDKELVEIISRGIFGDPEAGRLVPYGGNL